MTSDELKAIHMDQIHEEFKKVGTLLKGKREEMGYSLKEVENATSIRLNYLEAIEHGRIDQFLSSVYITGFVRQYGSFLNLDVDRIIREYPQAFKLPSEKHNFAYGIGTLEVRGSIGGGVRWLPNLLWAGASVTVLILAWYLAKYLGIF